MTDDLTPDPDVKLVTVFETADLGMVMLVKSILETAEIDYWIRGESLRNLMGWDPTGTLSGALPPAEFQVREPDAADATSLLADLVPTGEGPPHADG